MQANTQPKTLDLPSFNIFGEKGEQVAEDVKVVVQPQEEANTQPE